MDIIDIKGIGEKKAALFEKLGIKTTQDAIKFYPRKYEDRTIFKNISSLEIGDLVCIRAVLAAEIKTISPKRGFSISSSRIIDETGGIKIVFYNNKYIKSALKVGEEYNFFGSVSKVGNIKTLINPKIENKIDGKILPIYSSVKGLSQSDITKVCTQALQIEKIDEILPNEILEEYNFENITKCIQKIHMPKTIKDAKKAFERISFEECFITALGINYIKNRRNYKGVKLDTFDFSDINIPFDLTNSQKNTINDCLQDIKDGKPLNRMVQGDVGCGKTIVALVLGHIFAKNDMQTAIMVPTEILAIQHFETFKQILGDNVILLTANLKAGEKRAALQHIKNGSKKIIIGTQSLISKNAIYKNLALIIADEQHRFGVSQRAMLADKGENPHILVMSATPIPRSLSLILYGDLDVSIINEMPAGRIPVKTYLVLEKDRQRIINFISKTCTDGGQVYIVCPLAENNDDNNDDNNLHNIKQNSDLKNTEKYAQDLSKNIHHNVAFVHGKLKTSEKDKIMQDFKNGIIKVLVATTVIEVGINVPNANLMIIENAERFGLSALHQLRGRVGRGNVLAHCIMFSKNQNQRLDIMCKTNDGFKIAQKDLEIRGPGDFFGTRQHGEFTLDLEILQKASISAKKIIEKGLSNYNALDNIIHNLLENNNIFN